MDDLTKLHVVVAAPGPDGKPTFIETTDRPRLHVPGAVESVFVWGTDNGLDLSDGFGRVPSEISFPEPGGVRFAMLHFPAHSAGKMNVSANVSTGDADFDASDPGMHQTNSVDFEVILSGKIDIVLPGGQRRTLGPGSCLVMGGVMHAWENHYDEPCVYAAVIVGAKGQAKH
jgi:hypothetical protein